MANQYTKKKLINEKNRKELIWNIVNSLLAGSLIFLGSLTTGQLTWQGVVVGLVTAGIVAITKFQTYSKKKEKEYTKLFNFIHF